MKSNAELWNELYSEEVLSLINKPVKVNFHPESHYYHDYIYFTMQASMEITDGGRLWSCWIGGEDGSGAYLLAAYSDDRGESWSDIQFVIDAGNNDLPLIMNVHVAGLWKDPLGRLWMFYQQSYGMWDGEGANFAIICDDPDAEMPVWSDPVYISCGASLKKAIVTSKGEWLLPVSIWERWHISEPLTECHHELDPMRGGRVYASVDQGKTWEYRGGVEFVDSQFNEHSIVELSDGRIMMYSRCASAIKKTYSSDGGFTWTPEEIAFPHVGSLAVIRKLNSGNILLVKHGTNFTEATPKRSHLTAFVSDDDGETWKGGLLLDERQGVSYPEIVVGSDGTIYVQYDYNRTTDAQLLFARFTEDEVWAGSLSKEGSALRQIVKDTGGIKGKTIDYGEITPIAKGDGSRENPYLVENACQLKYLADQVAKGETFEGKYFRQTADLDFAGENIRPIGYWLQHGSHKRPFRGNYDGAGYQIVHFVQNAPALYSRGVFGYMTAGTVKNVRVANAFINGRNNTAAVVGYACGLDSDKVLIENCVTEADVKIICYSQVGGVAGRCEGNVTILHCENRASIIVPFSSGYEKNPGIMATSLPTGKSVNVGGIVGYIQGGATVSKCINYAEVYARHTAQLCIGGIVGYGDHGSVSECVNNGDVTAECIAGPVVIGGVIGWNDMVAKTDCLNAGKLQATGLGEITYAEE